ncbi:MAG: hypothetical protein ACR2FM_01355 [Candidatus Saccharimonadales bacterium]
MVATKFPLVDALLFIPEAAEDARIGICTNTTAAGQVYNEIDEDLRDQTAVLGSLIVSRDGAERMILNSLAHPTLQYIILFSEESLTFSPSTNLLQALQYGFDPKTSGNFIKNGLAASAQYPNLSVSILDAFRDQITVLPIFMFSSDYSHQVIDSYLDWLKPRVPSSLHELLVEINKTPKKYYDSLNTLIARVKQIPAGTKEIVELDAKEFQHLQPPLRELSPNDTKQTVPFVVSHDGQNIQVDLQVDKKSYHISGSDDFRVAFSLNTELAKNKHLLTPVEQLLLGVEIGRVSTELANDLTIPSFANTTSVTGGKKVELEAQTNPEIDTDYYYRIGIKEGAVSVMCMSNDLCEEVFELRSTSLLAIINELAELNRFQEYAFDFLHRVDVGIQIARAGIAAAGGYVFVQDFNTIFKINSTELPLLIADGDNFLSVHKNILLKIYSQGITHEHGDSHKGQARTAVALAIYRKADEALKTMPKIYQQGENPTTEIRKAYKQQLLRLDHDGTYSYGQRTRSFYGFDQLESASQSLTKNPARAALIQRFDPTTDMTSYIDPDSGKTKYTHDPCLTHDIFFTKNGKLHSFHMVRAHNMVNAYPENIFGLYDAYFCDVQNKLGVEAGDVFVLSNRGNILLLTEDQRTKKLLGEPSKPLGEEVDRSIGPYELGSNIKLADTTENIAYLQQPLATNNKRPASTVLDKLQNYNGQNTVQKAIDYLDNKGAIHNNPVLGEYRPGIDDPQGDYLAFFQANVFGDKLHATAVYMNHSLSSRSADVELLNYIATCFAKKLACPLGNLTLFYVACAK